MGCDYWGVTGVCMGCEGGVNGVVIRPQEFFDKGLGLEISGRSID